MKFVDQKVFFFKSRSSDLCVKKYKRAIVKFSGEMLRDGGSDALSPKIVRQLCAAIKLIRDGGIELGIVMGGGNIFRGMAANKEFGFDRVTGDYAGMLATVINSIIVADCFKSLNVAAEVFSDIPMPSVCAPYYIRCARQSLSDGKILLLAGGTGRAFFSTDSAAALRASELGADVIIKCTKVDGVYDKDPQKHGDAKKFSEISFRDALANRLNVMDSTAFSLCMDNNIPIVVVSAGDDFMNIGRALRGERIGTTISNF